MQTTGVWSYVRRLLRCHIWWYILSKTVYIKVYLMPPFFFAAVVMEDFSWRAGMACPEDFVFDQADVLQDGKISKMELSLGKHHSTGHLMQTCSWSWTVKLMRILTIKPRFWRSFPLVSPFSLGPQSCWINLNITSSWSSSLRPRPQCHLLVWWSQSNSFRLLIQSCG